MKLVLDTNTYVDFAQGREDVVELLAEKSNEILLPVVVLGELYYGFMRGRHPLSNHKKLHEFISRLGVNLIHVDQEVARKYSIIFFSLTRKGTRIPINDVWVAACCMNVGGTLVTRDRHFAYVEQIDKIILE